MLRFVGGIVVAHEVGWTGPWPPPERMGLAVGEQSGIVQVFQPGDVSEPDSNWLAEAKLAGTIRVMTYRLRNASTLPDSFDAPNLFRGADYVPDQEVL